MSDVESEDRPEVVLEEPVAESVTLEINDVIGELNG